MTEHEILPPPKNPIPTAAPEGVRGAQDVTCRHFANREWFKTSTLVPEELPLSIIVNGERLVTIICTPLKLDYLVIGFLYSEGIIANSGEVVSLQVYEDKSRADVRLSKAGDSSPLRCPGTRGSSGGIGFQCHKQRIDSNLTVTPAEIFSLMRQLRQQAQLFRACGGVHTSALSDTQSLLVIAEDIGRHNTLDKIQGECLLSGLSTKDRLLLTTGRLSSEMVLKASRMQTPIVVSRSSPTERAISLASDLGISLVGYTRSSRLSVYSNEERVASS